MMINILMLILCHLFFKTIVLKSDSNDVAKTFPRSLGNTNQQYKPIEFFYYTYFKYTKKIRIFR